MNRFGWMVLRAYLPAMVALLLAMAAMVWTSLLGQQVTAPALAVLLRWLPPLALLAALVAGAIATLRMWRWQHGQTPVCRGCGGLLGKLRHGAQGDYRKCLACGGHDTV